MRLNIFYLLFVGYCLHASSGGGGHKEKVHLKIHVPKIIKHHHHTKVVYVKKGKDHDHGHDDHGHGHGHEKKVIIHKHEHSHKHKHDHGHKHGHHHDHKHKHGHKHGHDHKHKHGHKHGHKHDHKHGHKHGHKHDHKHGHKHGHKHDHKHGHKHGHGHKHDHKHGHKHEHKKHEHKKSHDHYAYEPYFNHGSDDFEVERFQQPQVDPVNSYIVKSGYRVQESSPYDYTTKAYQYEQYQQQQQQQQQFTPSFGSSYEGYSPYAKKLYDYDEDIVVGKQAHDEGSHEDLNSYDYESEGGAQYDDGKENVQDYSDYSETQNAPLYSKTPVSFESQQQSSQISIQKVLLSNGTMKSR